MNEQCLNIRNSYQNLEMYIEYQQYLSEEEIINITDDTNNRYENVLPELEKKLELIRVEIQNRILEINTNV